VAYPLSSCSYVELRSIKEREPKNGLFIQMQTAIVRATFIGKRYILHSLTVVAETRVEAKIMVVCWIYYPAAWRVGI
jgi:hypothetical protein